MMTSCSILPKFDNELIMLWFVYQIIWYKIYSIMNDPIYDIDSLWTDIHAAVLAEGEYRNVIYFFLSQLLNFDLVWTLPKCFCCSNTHKILVAYNRHHCFASQWTAFQSQKENDDIYVPRCTHPWVSHTFQGLCTALPFIVMKLSSCVYLLIHLVDFSVNTWHIKTHRGKTHTQSSSLR